MESFSLILADVAVALFFCEQNSYVCLIRCELPRFFVSNFYLQNRCAKSGCRFDGLGFFAMESFSPILAVVAAALFFYV